MSNTFVQGGEIFSRGAWPPWLRAWLVKSSIKMHNCGLFSDVYFAMRH